MVYININKFVIVNSLKGRVSFETTGSRARSRVLIVQYRLENKDNVTKTAVAYIEPVNDLLVYTNNQANETVFPSQKYLVLIHFLFINFLFTQVQRVEFHQTVPQSLW